jgi:two-component system phosphate regulon response regulator PhoB
MSLVYIVEDNDLIRNGVAEYFQINGYEVSGFPDIQSIREALAHRLPDIILLDVMLPDGNGFIFAREIRESWDVPILFLTAREDESDRIMGFEVGGDDYVVKPFSNKELLLRVAALLRRVTASDTKEEEAEDPRVYALGEHRLIIDLRARKVSADGEERNLTATEWNILTFLAERPEQAVSRDTLLGECLGYLYSGSERTVDTHIANLRSQLGGGDWIETVRSFGYRFAGLRKA